jgi:hypothetical protein
MGFDSLDFFFVFDVWPGFGFVPERLACSPTYPGSAIVDRGNLTFTFVDDLQNMMMVGTRNQGAFSVCLMPTGEEVNLAPLTKFVFSCRFDVDVQVHIISLNILATWTPRTNYMTVYILFSLYPNTYD